ncbi:hypothetical protein CIHG_06752 [Coccidioides immitis H538.4]|uniref:Uncharacterized protein n=3 Tax=Coccidioides immitis TaxID=5501 RepID=A0A0J8QYQ3_COCIT|nr:hypothetical protein CIRG_01651 [Coccidioides immitis RMSCC 2394]KMU76513.1 hypothetical protein CISG_01246 [Coccidioides immitis RMSCC 3703]KMU88951.1 hypothetical protein CIHG_06752 [Coccidioides immitis H538.4]
MQLLVTLGEQDADFPARSGPAQVASRPGITALPGPELDLDLQAVNPDPPMTAATALYQGSELGSATDPRELPEFLCYFYVKRRSTLYTIWARFSTPHLFNAPPSAAFRVTPVDELISPSQTDTASSTAHTGAGSFMQPTDRT